MPYEIHEDKIVMRAEQYNLPKPWQGLTDEDCKNMSEGDRAFVMWVEAKLKDKNT